MRQSRTRQESACPGAASGESRAIGFAGIWVDLVFRRLCVQGAEYPLSPKELVLMHTLLRQEGALVGRAQLCAAIGAREEDAALENHVYRLRKKLGRHADLLVSQRKQGYRVDPGRLTGQGNI